MLSPITAASVNPAALAPQSPTPRADDLSQGKSVREIGTRFDPVRPADPARSGDLRPSLATWEPDPIRPSPERAALFEATRRTASGEDDEEAPVLRAGEDDAARIAPAGPAAPDGAGWEPETFRPRADGDARLEPLVPLADAGTGADARPSPAETAAYEQAVKGYAQLGSYAGIQWKLNMAA